MSHDTQNRFQIPPEDAPSTAGNPLWIDLFAANGITAAILSAAFQIILWIGVERDQPPPPLSVTGVILPLVVGAAFALHKRVLRYRAARIAAWLILVLGILFLIASVFSNADAARS